jgi:hypothetical protein
MGIETVVAECPPEALATVDKLCAAFDIRFGVPNRDRDSTPQYRRPESTIEACKGRTDRIGACADVGEWLRSGIDPGKGLSTLGKRVISLKLRGAALESETTARAVLKEVRRLGLAPTMFAVDDASDNAASQLKQAIELLNSLSLELAAQ